MKQFIFLLFALYFVGGAYSIPLGNSKVTNRKLHAIAVKQINEAPVANAGADVVTFEGDTVVLNGTLSNDPDNDALSYEWTAPSGIILDKTNMAKPWFVAPKVLYDTTLTFSLVVNDGTVSSNVDKVLITVRKENKPPVAITGANVEKFEGDTTTLDGSRSYDPEESDLTYIWTTLDGETLSANENCKITFTIPKYLKDTVLVITLRVNDGVNYSEEARFSITVWHINIAPVANAGKNFETDEGMTATLNGSLSYDPEKRPLVYKWTAPQGITLSSVFDPKPSFLSPEVLKDTVYCFSLVVNDGLLDSETRQVKITVRQVNKVPMANAGIDFWVNEGTQVILDGSLSSDQDKDILTYKWMAPNGITLSSSTVCRPIFMSPEVFEDTTYHFFLVVNDGKIDSPPSRVSITVRQVNKAPEANAGIDFGVNEGAVATLNGSLSSDEDGDVLMYQWMAPNGITLDSTLSACPTFTAPEVYQDTTYTFILVVNDGKTDSSPKTVRVVVKNIVKPTFFKVYPNPSTGIVTVEFCTTPENMAKAFISTVSGIEILRKEITERSHFRVDLSNHSNGVYILTIQDNEHWYHQQIILQKE